MSCKSEKFLQLHENLQTECRFVMAVLVLLSHNFPMKQDCDIFTECLYTMTCHKSDISILNIFQYFKI